MQSESRDLGIGWYHIIQVGDFEKLSTEVHGEAVKHREKCLAASAAWP